ncbi:MAG: elongation factor Ts [Ardenticatenaceae bacterium]
MDCKRALEQANGDLNKAEEILRQKGIASAAKKASRATNDGVIESYIHSGGRIAALVEVNCETDFVARTADFKDLAHDIAMQVAAMAPLYVDESEIPEGADVSPDEVCLLNQPFIKDPSKTIQELVNEAVGKLGENIRVRRFTRFALGE